MRAKSSGKTALLLDRGRSMYVVCLATLCLGINVDGACGQNVDGVSNISRDEKNRMEIKALEVTTPLRNTTASGSLPLLHRSTAELLPRG